MALRDLRLVGAAAAWLALSLVACGDDDDDSTPLDGSMSDGGGGSGGTGNLKDAGDKDGGPKAGSTATAGSSGGGAGTMAVPMGATCDPEIPTTATCGGTACPASMSPFASFVCAVPCCLPDDSCGSRRAILDDATDCVAPAEPDPSCPDRAGMGMGGMPGGGAMDAGAATDAGGDAGGMSIPGCCAPSGRCGIISPIDMSCITSSTLLADLAPGAPCGEDADGGELDAGH